MERIVLTFCLREVVQWYGMSCEGRLLVLGLTCPPVPLLRKSSYPLKIRKYIFQIHTIVKKIHREDCPSFPCSLDSGYISHVPVLPRPSTPNEPRRVKTNMEGYLIFCVYYGRVDGG